MIYMVIDGINITYRKLQICKIPRTVYTHTCTHTLKQNGQTREQECKDLFQGSAVEEWVMKPLDGIPVS